MPQRTYNQYCPLAHALDLVGERWTLLIIRNLFLGPKRFSDLLSGLPGLGTNILTDRLKTLEETGLIQSRYLPPPAASSVYELTPYGRSLEDVMVALTLWGTPTLGTPKAGQTFSTESIGLMVYMLFKEALRDQPGAYAVHIHGKPLNAKFTVKVQDGIVTVEPEAVPPPPTGALTLQANLETVAMLATHHLSFAQALKQGALKLEGPASETAKFRTRVEVSK